MCGFSGSFGEDVRADLHPSGQEITFLLSASELVRSGDLDLDTCEVTSYLSGNMGGFIGPGRGVDKGERFFV